MTAPVSEITAAALDDLLISPLSWTVPGLIPEGFGILAAAPKIGKSWFVLSLGLAAAAGTSFLGVGLAKRPVLYLAMEDSQRRLQARMRRILGDQLAPKGMVMVTERNDALDHARRFALKHSGADPLIMIDTLQLVRGGYVGRPNYGDDYNFGVSLKAIGDCGGTVFGVHHTRKQEADDFLETASGTNGLTGAADFVMVLDRNRSAREGILHVTGRDIAEGSYSMSFNDGLWRINGTDLSEAARLAVSPNLSDNMISVLTYVNDSNVADAASVANALKIKNDTASKYLRRLADEHGLIDRIATGQYGPKVLSECLSGA
jgi:RecA-family ATPase